MNEKQIEVNSDFKSIAASWLGVDLADLKTENRADLDDAQENTSFLNSKVKTISFHTEKLDDIQTVFPKAKVKNGLDSTAMFVGGKLQRKLQKAKRRKDEAKDGDSIHSSIRQEQYFDEDSKASAIQSKSKTLSKHQNMDLHNSEENIRRLLATTKDKNTKKKLRRKLKKLLKKSCGSINSENESNMPSQTSVETSTQLQEHAVTNTSKKKKKKPSSPISETNVSRIESENNDQALIVSNKTSTKTSIGKHLKNGSKKTKKQKQGSTCR
ncbi:uncharacterized protein LOC121368107 [Gigantopelta aegis]|uniref:uncharacterized protein LOC121368107 n=1 Tax=Gigantopelta aegis TaxID=1735272 RepID=UPI001B88982B|nr:uncharacterized protein LOC121368107 [Gigantopelta aegis]